jgi:hypothetical protein
VYASLQEPSDRRDAADTPQEKAQASDHELAERHGQEPQSSVDHLMRLIYRETVEQDACRQGKEDQTRDECRAAEVLLLREQNEDEEDHANQHQAVEGSLDHDAGGDAAPAHPRPPSQEMRPVDLPGPCRKDIVDRVPNENRCH